MNSSTCTQLYRTPVGLLTFLCHRYLRALAAMYVRMTFRAAEVYALLEPLLKDYRKLRLRNMSKLNLSVYWGFGMTIYGFRWLRSYLYGRVRRSATQRGASVRHHVAAYPEKERPRRYRRFTPQNKRPHASYGGY